MSRNRQRLDDSRPGKVGGNLRRCSATTRDGQPCRQNPLLGSGLPLCMIHAGLSGLEEVPPERRCTATTLAGSRCRLYALEGSDPPLCQAHGRPGYGDPPPERRCGAQTREGRRCRHYAVRDSDPPRCGLHRRPLPAVPSKRHCTAGTRGGRQCRQWAMHESDPPRCSVHAGLTEPGPAERCTATTRAGGRCPLRATADSERPLCHVHAGRQWPPPEERRCTAQLPGGGSCPNWAVRGEDPPLCATHSGRAGFPRGHRYRVTHGFYIRRLSTQDLAGIAAERKALEEGRLNLDEELYLCRWLALQLAKATRPDRLKTLSVKQIARYVGLILRLLKTIEILLEAKREIGAAKPTFPESP